MNDLKHYIEHYPSTHSNYKSQNFGAEGINSNLPLMSKPNPPQNEDSSLDTTSSLVTFEPKLAEIFLQNVGEVAQSIDHFPVGTDLPIHPTLTNSDIFEKARQFSDITSPNKIWAICNAKVPGWSSLREDDVVIGQLMMGLSNQLFAVHIKESHPHQELFDVKEILFRIYGKDVRSIYDPAVELKVFKQLAKCGVAPRFIAEFEGGRIEEWIKGGALLNKDMGTTSVLIAVATIVANIHSMDLSPHIDSTPCIYKYLQRWGDGAMKINAKVGPDHPNYHNFQKLDLPKLHEESFSLKQYLFPQFAPLCEVLELVFCHNDMQENNIMIHKDCLRLIDFEYSGYNYPAFDIASYFWEMTCDYTYPEPPYFLIQPSNYPSLEQRQLFCAVYLTNVNKKQVKSSDTLKMNITLAAVERFLLACHMLWGFWAVIRAPQAATATSFDMLKYAQTRIDAYWAHKEKLLAQGLIKI